MKRVESVESRGVLGIRLIRAPLMYNVEEEVGNENNESPDSNCASADDSGRPRGAAELSSSSRVGM